MKYGKQVLTLALALSVGLSSGFINRLNVAASDETPQAGGPSAKIDYVKEGDNGNFKLNLILSNVTDCTCAELKFTYDTSKVSTPVVKSETIPTIDATQVTLKDQCSMGIDDHNGQGEYDSESVTGIWANFNANVTAGEGDDNQNKNTVTLGYIVHPAVPTVESKVGNVGENSNSRCFTTKGEYKFLSIPFSLISETAISEGTSEIINIVSLGVVNNGSVMELVGNGLTIDTSIKDETTPPTPGGNTVTLHANGGTFKAANFASDDKGTLSEDKTTLTLTIGEDGQIKLPNRVDITSPHARRMFLCWSTKNVPHTGKVTTTNVPNDTRMVSGSTQTIAAGTNLYAVWAYVGDFNGDGRIILTELGKELSAYKGTLKDVDKDNNPCDLNNDGRVILTELGAVLHAYKNTSTAGYFDVK